MACFKLPKKTLDKLTSLVADFWWKNDNTGRGIHWSAWKNLTSSKQDGGLGFRDLEGFNQAMLGKQIWRLASRPNSLLAQFLKSRYYPKCSVLEAKIGNRPSFAWRSIHGAQALMSVGLQKDFGNGEEINFFKDPWLPQPQPRPPVPKTNIDVDDIHINWLKDHNSDQWNISRLKQVCDDSEVNEILKILPTSKSGGSGYFWQHNPSGQYTVKSGYRQWKTRFNSQTTAPQRPNTNMLFEEIWKLKCTPKIHHFLWRVLSGKLAVGETLKKRKIIHCSDCPRCGQKTESINHLLFECGYARLVWASSPAGFLFHPYPSDSLFANIAELLLVETKESRDRVAFWPWLIWRIWKDRNDMCFSSPNSEADVTVRLAEQDCKAWHIANSPPTQVSKVSHSQSIGHTWKRPIQGHFKCNIDGSWSDTAETCGIGWILRDVTGRGRWYGSKTLPALTSPLDVEAAALIWAMSVIDNLGFTKVTFETDCKSLYQAVKDPTDWPRLQCYSLEILKERRHLQPSFSWIPRTANSVADIIAKKAVSLPVYSASVECILPSWLLMNLTHDTPCMNLISL